MAGQQISRIVFVCLVVGATALVVSDSHQGSRKKRHTIQAAHVQTIATGNYGIVVDGSPGHCTDPSILMRNGYSTTSISWDLRCQFTFNRTGIMDLWFENRRTPINNRPVTHFLPLLGTIRGEATWTIMPPFNRNEPQIFMTAPLSGCSVFIAEKLFPPQNLVVIHANGCGDASYRGDKDHDLATNLLNNFVGSNNYRISVRLAGCQQPGMTGCHLPGNNQNRDYRVVYYEDIAFAYGFVGGWPYRWQFCFRRLSSIPNPQPFFPPYLTREACAGR